MDAISKVFNANVYIDGTNNLIGRAKEITLPDVAVKMIEHSALGMIGTVELPAGLEKLETKVKWSGFYPDALTMGANPYIARKLQVRANVEKYAPGGRVEQKPLLVQLTCTFKKSPGGTFGSKEDVEIEQELATSYMRVVLDGEELLEVDIFANVWRVGGVDVLENYNKALGG